MRKDARFNPICSEIAAKAWAHALERPHDDVALRGDALSACNKLTAILRRLNERSSINLIVKSLRIVDFDGDYET